jgi:Flp pilus assembly pilin Flp
MNFLGGTSMKKAKSFSRNLLKNQSGQGATEYILLLVVVVALVLMFKNQIKTTVDEKIKDLQGMIGQVDGN